jgi:hypothetical protein
MQLLKHSSLITIWCLLLSAGYLSAHHQLGLPHYLYSKDYPQIPTMFIEADAEGYVVTFSIFPGNPVPDQTVRIKIYIKNKLTGEVYTRPIEMSVTKDTFFGGENELVPPRFVESDYNEYKMSYEFSEAEKYFINVTFEPRRGFFEKMPFPIVIGETNFSLIPVIFGGTFLCLFIVVGFSKKRQIKKREVISDVR